VKLRIVGLGDSTTAGTPGFLSPLEVPPNGRGNPESQYAYWMMKKHPDWTVLNRGIDGQRSDEILARFDRDTVKAKPNYVIILAGVNDIYQGAPLESIKNNLLLMWQNSISAGIRPISASVLPYNTASHSEAATIRDLNSWIEYTANRLEIPFCDTNLAVADPENRDHLRGSPDGYHPNVSGYRSMGESLARVIEADIER
jgi:acyl-CoA thioesterase-1